MKGIRTLSPSFPATFAKRDGVQNIPRYSFAHTGAHVDSNTGSPAEALSRSMVLKEGKAVSSRLITPVISAASLHFFNRAQRVSLRGAGAAGSPEGLSGGKTGRFISGAEFIFPGSGMPPALWKTEGTSDKLQLHTASSSAEVSKAHLTAAEDRFYFHSRRIHQDIVREIEEMKEQIAETKKTVTSYAPSPLTGTAPGNSADMARHLDMNTLSDQVYRNLERRIRAERERRGV